MVTLYKFAVILLMLLLNGLFAAFEMALATVPRSRLVVRAGRQRRGAKAALAMKQRMEASLAVVQVGITVAGAIAAAVEGVGIEETLSPWIVRRFAFSTTAADVVAIAIFVIPLSAVTIVFAELVPKMFGIRNSERVCLLLAPAMRVLATILYPIVAIFEKVVKAVLAGGARLMNNEKAAPGAPGLRELHAAVSMARTARLIGACEEKIPPSAATLPVRPLASILVPAASISLLSASSSLADALLAVHLDPHTRFPVCTEPDDPQTIIGYVTFKDLVVALRMEARKAVLRSITRPIRRFRGSETIAQALDLMIRERTHIALVVDSGGEVLGMVTLEDIMEELVGEIEDEFDRLPTHLHRTDVGWIAGGGDRRDAVASALGADAAGISDGLSALTIADWCPPILGRPVKKGETIRWEELRIAVRKLRRQEIAECFLSREAENQAGPTG